MSLEGRTALVTGGGTGIGRAIALALAREGATVWVAGRRTAPLEAVVAEAERIHAVAVDVTDETSVAAMFDFTGPCDIVVANAGAGRAAKLADTALADWNAMLAVNLTGTFLTFRAALAGMGEGGRLIAIGSTASLKGGASIAAYAAAKHGVLGLVRSLALEVARRGITCNAVCPGYVETEMAEAAIAGMQARFGLDRDAAIGRVVASNPVKRLIAAEEVAAAVLYLALPEAAMVNGHALALSGGET